MNNEYIDKIKQIALPNKYTKIYLQIISKVSIRSGYCESHHILPKCFKMGGEADSTNLVNLTPREHYICHLLLTKMFTEHRRVQMNWALKMMCSTRKQKSNIKINSSIYNKLKTEHSNYMKTNNPNKDGKYSKLAWDKASLDRHARQSQIMTKRNLLYWASRKNPSIELICQNCGSTFVTPNKKRICCGKSCSTSLNNKRRGLRL